MDPFIAQTEQYIAEGGLIPDGARLIAGVSGGVDSVSLLEVLDVLRKSHGWSLTVVHVHHGIRGESADEDEAFVRMLCRAKGLKCRVHQADIPALAREQGLSEEEAGRLERRRIFEEELMRATQDGSGADRGSADAAAGRIVLAHHADDNAETFLMNLARGSGLSGLGGMRPEKDDYVRPFLWAKRLDIEEFAIRNHIAFRLDESNRDLAYTRNRIRLAVIPYMQENVNSALTDHINGAMEELRSAADYLERQVDRMESAYVSEPEQNRLLILQEAAGEDPYLLSLLFRRSLIRAAGAAKDIGRAHIRAAAALFQGQTGKFVMLPYGLRAQRTYDGVCIERAGQDEKTVTESASQGAHFTAQRRFVSRAEAVLKSSDPYTKYFDYGIIGEQSSFRTRQPGDYIVIDREGHRQKVKDWMIDHKIPRDERERIPLLADGSHVYWIAGYRQAQDCLVTDTTETIIEWKIGGFE